MIELQGEVERRDGGSLEEAFDVGTLSVTSSVSSRGPRTHVRIQAARPRPWQPPTATDRLPAHRPAGRHCAAHHRLSPTGGEAAAAEETAGGAGEARWGEPERGVQGALPRSGVWVAVHNLEARSLLCYNRGFTQTHSLGSARSCGTRKRNAAAWSPNCCALQHRAMRTLMRPNAPR